MDLSDIAVRNLTYRLFADHGRAPTVVEVAAAGALDVDVVGDAWRRLHDDHAIVLQPGTLELRMANPFSAVPTRFRVQAAGREWYANCAWDAFGICAALHQSGRIETTCPDCAAPIECEVHDERPSDPSLVFHCLVPAAHWWDDIVFT